MAWGCINFKQIFIFVCTIPLRIICLKWAGSEAHRCQSTTCGLIRMDAASRFTMSCRHGSHEWPMFLTDIGRISLKVSVSLCVAFKTSLEVLADIYCVVKGKLSQNKIQNTFLTFPEDWIPFIIARHTMVQAANRHKVILQLSPPLSEMESEMSKATRYQ